MALQTLGRSITQDELTSDHSALTTMEVFFPALLVVVTIPWSKSISFCGMGFWEGVTDIYTHASQVRDALSIVPVEYFV